MKDHQDAYGRLACDYFQSKDVYIVEVVEREDGYIGTSSGPKAYFSEHKDWPPHQRKAMRYVKGRALDIGCGAGRHSLYLQEKGFDVVGVDVSPLAIEVCKRRGLKNAYAMPITRVSSKLGKFDTILMLGNNFGLFGSFNRAKWLLRRFHAITNQNARIIAESNDPYQTTKPCHLEYHELNRRRGRMPGQLRIRVRHEKYATPWFDYLLASKEEMEGILEGTGWQVRRYIDSEGSAYIALIEKRP